MTSKLFCGAVAAASTLLAGVAIAQTAHPDFTALIQRIPAPPGSVAEVAQQAKNSQKIDAEIRQLHREMAGIKRNIQMGPVNHVQTETKQNGLNAMGVHDKASALAIQNKLSHMSREEKLAWMKQYQQRSVQANLASRRRRGVRRASPAAQQALAKISEIQTTLLGPYNEHTGRRDPSLTGKLSAKLAATDKKLHASLQALSTRYPSPSVKELGYDGGYVGSDADMRIIKYVHGHKLCHRYWDNTIRQDKARAPLYENWLRARKAAWRSTHSQLNDLATEEQTALQKVDLNTLAADRATTIKGAESFTLDAIDFLIETSRSYKDNPDFKNNVAETVRSDKQSLHACLKGTWG